MKPIAVHAVRAESRSRTSLLNWGSLANSVPDSENTAVTSTPYKLSRQ